MPSAQIVRAQGPSATHSAAALPQILETENGIMLVEIQGTINVGDLPLTGEDDAVESAKPITQMTDIGDMDFVVSESGPTSVTLIVGKRQKLVGKIVKLVKPLAILSMPDSPEATEIPVSQVLTHKVVFSDRPEPYMQATE